MNTPDITQSNLSAAVDMGRINAGFLDAPETTQTFIDTGIAPLLPATETIAVMPKPPWWHSTPRPRRKKPS